MGVIGDMIGDMIGTRTAAGRTGVAAPSARLRNLLAGLALVSLTACGGGNEVAPLEVQLIQAGQARLQQLRAGKAEPLVLTRALLDTVEDPFIEATIERLDQKANLLLRDRRRDDQPGDIEVWRTGDDVTLTTRNGVLIATRGLGGNLLSTEVQLAGNRPGPASGGARVMMIRAQDNKELRMALACELEDLGPKTIVIVQKSQETRHLRETCVRAMNANAGDREPGRTGTVINDYWVDSKQGLIWQSRQWAGPEIGYLLLRRLTI